MASYSPRKRDATGKILTGQIKVSRGRDPVTKKPLRSFTKTFTRPDGWSDSKTLKELERVAGAFQASCDRGEVLTKEQKKAAALEQAEQANRKQAEQERKPTFARYVEIFLNEKAATLAHSTIITYRQVLKKAAAVFGNMRMEEITNLTIKQYINDLMMKEKNEVNGLPLAYRTVMRHYIALHSLFQSAVDSEILTISPMANMKRPKPRKDDVIKEPISYSESEIQYIMECLNKEPLKWKALVMFAIDSGARRGEIVGMKWSEIDFQTGKANIVLNIQHSTDRGSYITTPKSHKNRSIYLNRPVLTVLQEWRREQAALLLAQGIPASGFCFTQENGQVLSPDSVTSYLGRFGKKYNLPGIHPHALRHSMATISIANGADILSVSKKLGHSNPSITLNVYSHANEEAQQRANAVLADALYKDNKKA